MSHVKALHEALQEAFPWYVEFSVGNNGLTVSGYETEDCGCCTHTVEVFVSLKDLPDNFSPADVVQAVENKQ